MRERSGRVHRATFWAWVAAILGTAAAQSTVHLYVVLDRAMSAACSTSTAPTVSPTRLDRRTRDGSGGRRPSARRPRRQNSASAHCAPDAADDRRRRTRRTAPGIAHRLARDWRSRHDRGAARGRRRPRGVPRAGDTRSRRLRAPRLVLRQFARPTGRRPLRTRTRGPDRRVPDRRQGGVRADRLVARGAYPLGRGAPAQRRGFGHDRTPSYSEGESTL